MGKRESRLVSRVGERVGKLVVVERMANKDEGNSIRSRWMCKCDCGNSIAVLGHHLTKGLNGSGGVRSCGCMLREKPVKHGRCNTRAYRTWHMMLQRCLNPKNSAYRSYGGRGITVCEEWRDFQAFYADMGDPPAEHTIDRIDNSLGYTKGNCRWATKKQQGNNRRSNTFFTHGGKKQTLAQWADETGLKPQCLMNRLNAGWTLEKTLTTPKLSHKTS
jgi:hypothetical protein